MALDTRNKRSSAVNISLPWRALLPEPDGTIGQDNRFALAFFYAGFVVQSLSPSLFANTNVFYAPTASATYTLTPSLFSDGDTFYSPAITTQQDISPGLLIDAPVFYAPRVGLGTPPQKYPANICMRSGLKTRPSELYREWTGLMVRREDLDPRHPQDFVRARKDDQTVPNPRPEPTDIFLDSNEVTRESL
jgi:hypothetical protein